MPYSFQRNLAAPAPEDVLECITGLLDRPSEAPADFGGWMLPHFGEGIT
ncbi:hypothetical protein V7793_10805 [Streptomyces sp. KLMMK]